MYVYINTYVYIYVCVYIYIYIVTETYGKMFNTLLTFIVYFREVDKSIYC